MHKINTLNVDTLRQIVNQKQINELISSERERIETEVTASENPPIPQEGIIHSEKSDRKEKFDKYVDNMLEDFNDLKDEESTAKFVVKLREMFVKDPQEFRAIAKLR